jgi:phosphate transport system permease protein
MEHINKHNIGRNVQKRKVINNVNKVIFIASTCIAIFFLLLLLYRILTQGISYLSFDFLNNFPSRHPENAGIKAGMIGTLWVMAVTGPVSLMLGVSTAIYLEEYAKKNWFTRMIQINIQNLAGVPSIVFGLLGLTAFVYLMNLGPSILAGALTMSLLILPIIVVSAQEAIRAVPSQMREASYGMGATKWQTISQIVLPSALPGIITGGILALSRAIGETAPLIVIGATVAIYTAPASIMEKFTVMPIQIFNWTSRPQEEFHFVAASGIIILLILLLIMNSIAVLIRNKFQKRY